MANSVSLESIWGVLSSRAADSVDGSLYCIQLEETVEAGNVLAAVDSSGCYEVLVPLLPDERGVSPERDARILLHSRQVDSHNYVGVACHEPRLNDVFLIFVRSLVEQLPKAGEAVIGVVKFVNRWRALFAAAERSAVLTQPQLAGLLGELQVLERIIKNNPHQGLSTWSGPEKSKHDFRSPGNAVEVKSTLASNGSRARIHGIGQLDASDGTSLHLAFLRFESSPDGISVPQQIDKIRQYGISYMELERKLLYSGYREQHRSYYNTIKFLQSDESWFNTETFGFPKIVPKSFATGDIPVGVESIEYTIDLSSMMAHSLNEDRIDEVIGKLVTGIEA